MFYMKKSLRVSLFIAFSMLFLSGNVLPLDNAVASNHITQEAVDKVIEANEDVRKEVRLATSVLSPWVDGDTALADRYARTVVRYSKEQGLPLSLTLGVVLQESLGDSAAVSRVGAVGLMQIMPIYWEGVYEECGDNLFNPETNVCYGTRILKYYLDENGGNVRFALSDYNGDKSYRIYYRNVLAWAGRVCSSPTE